ncbi:hypothetical protein OG976_07025 [Mycobacterium sp. NBC_00419]|uniref:hypothetical protein n=1 Tax=Mycobacterium sp. NBC_00419 TaxID=2975989 RepID=UPI002E24CEDE
MSGRVTIAAIAALIALGAAPSASADCQVQPLGPSSVDGLLADIPGFLVQQGCPAVGSPFAGADMKAVTAGEISRDGTTVMSVFAGELNDGSGAAFVHDTVLAALPGTAIETQTVAGYPVTYFNSRQLGDGYLYADGRTVLVAYDTAWPQSGSAAKEILPTLLGRIRPA